MADYLSKGEQNWVQQIAILQQGLDSRDAQIENLTEGCASYMVKFALAERVLEAADDLARAAEILLLSTTDYDAIQKLRMCQNTYNTLRADVILEEPREDCSQLQPD